MKLERSSIAAMATLALLAACGGGGGTTNPPAAGTERSARALASVEPPGSRCPAGGARIDAGIDSDGNGVLDAGEIASTQYVCDGTVGAAGAAGLAGLAGAPGVVGPIGPMGPTGVAALVQLSPETAGLHCAGGGTKINAGADANGNGVLDPAEITSVGYVCAAADGIAGSQGHDSLMRMTTEGPSVACPSGGSLVEAGLDSNRNGTLDSAEVTATSRVCNGTNGTNGTGGTNGTNGTSGTLTVSVAEAAGAHCAAGGLKLTSGPDSNGNSTLDPSEVAATSYVCNGIEGWVAVTALAVQAQANTGYVANNAAQVTVTLPASPGVGDVVRVSGAGTGGWKIAQNAGQSIVTTHLDVATVATAWTDRMHAAVWRAIASSADGSRLIAAPDQDYLSISPDGGITLFQVEAIRSWTGVASSADGRRLVAVAYGQAIRVSDDYGANWTARGPNAGWRAVASSADGRVLAAAPTGQQIHVSEDYGVNWTARGAQKDWSAIALSADGSRIVAASSGGTVDVSYDFGASWTSRLSNQDWHGVASSADGRVLVAVGWNLPIFTSDDFGATWLPGESARLWSSVTASADGSRLVAVAGDDPNAATTAYEFIYASSDRGLTWTPRAVEDGWYAVASSADGSRLAAVSEGYGSQSLWTSVPTPVGATTSGTTGAITGKQYQAIELQYLGLGQFMVIDAIGTEFEVQ